MANTFTPAEISQILEEFFKVVGTRQYIGARYVPIFGRKGEDSIVWDNTKSYEPLTIVLYQGNSFTSRQYVPEGVDIQNQEYWAETGNYNAQIEQYKQEVQTVVDEMAELSNVVNKFGVSYVGNYGAVENDDSVNWQSIFNQIAEISNTVDFGNGQWIVNEEISVPENIKTICGCGSVIKSTEHVGCMFTVDRNNPDYITNRYFFTMSGLKFFSTFNVDSIIKSTISQTHIENCTFKDFIDYGVDLSAAGGTVVNCNFIISNNGETFTNETNGCVISTDSRIEGCTFFALHNCIVVQDNCTISNNYFWIGTLQGLNYCISSKTINSTTSVASIIFNNNEIDGYPCLFNNIAGDIKNNLLLFNGVEINYQDAWTIFNYTTPSFKSLIFNDNILDFVYGFQHELHTFITTRADAVSTYSSKDNIVLNSRNEVVNNLYVGFGTNNAKYVKINSMHLFSTNVQGVNISYDEMFNYQGKYVTYIADVSGALYISVANVQNDSAFVLTPKLNKKTSDATLVLTSIRRGGPFNNIVSRSTVCLFEFLPTVPDDIIDSDITLNVSRPKLTI